MPSHHFISYSSADAQDFALRLCDTLAAGPPSFPVWLDKRKLQAGEDWDAQIVEAIKTCVSMLFVMTSDSVEDESVCKNEWVSALSYKKLIVAIKLHHDAELPFRLASRRFIDFTGEFEPALARLRERLQWLDSPAGTLRTLKDRRADAQRDLRRTAEAARRHAVRGRPAHPWCDRGLPGGAGDQQECRRHRARPTVVRHAGAGGQRRAAGRSTAHSRWVAGGAELMHYVFG